VAGPNDFDAIRTAVLQKTSDNTVIIAMLVGAGLESDWHINEPGGGAFQITDAARPGPTGTDVALGKGAATSQLNADVAYMLPRYSAAAATHKADPESADKYANIAHDAERPKQTYQQSQGEPKVKTVYQTVLQNYGGVTATATAPVETTNPVLSFLSPVLSFLSKLADPHLWRSLAWIVLGGLLMLLGVVLWLRKAVSNVAKSVL
jgi:hypothetical protein